MEKRDLYDEKRNLTGETILKGDKTPEGKYIVVVLVFIQNSEGKFLIQKRSERKNGKFASTGGHPKSGESSIEGILTEVEEEIGLELNPNGNTIFYSTHILNEVSKICDRVGIIKDGKLIKVEKIEDLSKKSLTFVTITSEQSKEIAKELKVNIISEEGNTIKFGNNLPHDELIKKLSKYKIDRILIEEATLEDMFLHYYK